jgi:hypothetical protein
MISIHGEFKPRRPEPEIFVCKRRNEELTRG